MQPVGQLDLKRVHSLEQSAWPDAADGSLDDDDDKRRRLQRSFSNASRQMGVLRSWKVKTRPEREAETGGAGGANKGMEPAAPTPPLPPATSWACFPLSTRPPGFPAQKLDAHQRLGGLAQLPRPAGVSGFAHLQRECRGPYEGPALAP